MTVNRRFRTLVLALCACLVACASPPPRAASVASASGSAPAPAPRLAPPAHRQPSRARIEETQIPLQTPGGEIHLAAAAFWPEDATPDRPRPTIVFSHGSPLKGADREHMTVLGYSWALQWFIQRGYVVIAALRRGFGASEGHFSEGLDHTHFDYAKAGRTAASDIGAALAYAQSLPGVDPKRIVLVGHSAGGFGSLALASEGVPVIGVISFAGGKGAQLLGDGPPYTTAIEAAAGDYGRTTHVPSLWIYADNDKYFAPAIATAMFDAYRSGGAPAEFVRLRAVGQDGHALFTEEAVPLWTEAVEHFLQRIGAQPS